MIAIPGESVKGKDSDKSSRLKPTKNIKNIDQYLYLCKNPPLLFGGQGEMTLLEEDLLAALKELLGASEIMANGTPASEDEMTRYYQSTEWAKRAISHADDNERFKSNQVKHH